MRGALTGVPIRLRVAGAFAVAMAVLLVAIASLLYLRVGNHLSRAIDDQLRLRAELPSRSVGPLRFEAHRLAPGDYAVHGAQLPLAGSWEVLIEGRRGEFEALTGAVSIPIEGGN